VAGPWDKYGAQQPAAGGPVFGTPPTVDPFKARDQQLQEEAAARAREDQDFQRRKFEREMAKKDEDSSKPSDTANTAAFLATRVAGGMRDIATALKENPGNEKPGIIPSIAGAVSDDARNLLNTTGRQRIEAAQLDILDSALTLGTGAAYSKEQLAGYQRSYFPQIGDDPKTISDKQLRLRRLLEAAKLKAGAAAPSIDEALAALDAMGGTVPETGRTTTYDPNMGAENGVPALDVSVEGGRDPTPQEIAADPQRYADAARLNAMKANGGGAGSAAIAGAADSLTFGGLDELGAGVDALGGALSGQGSFGDLYGQNVETNRAYQDFLQKEHPYAYGGGQLAGGLAIPFGAGATGIRGFATAGALQGGAYGFRLWRRQCASTPSRRGGWRGIGRRSWRNSRRGCSCGIQRTDAL
jgi:hypothetical protein